MLVLSYVGNETIHVKVLVSVVAVGRVKIGKVVSQSCTADETADRSWLCKSSTELKLVGPLEKNTFDSKHT